MSSSCCGGNCGCGSDRKCGSGCGGRCKMYPEEASAAATTAPTGVAPSTKGHAENDGCKCGPNCTCDPCKCGDAGSEAAGSAENDGCKCGPNCTCDPCNCGK